MPLVLECGVSPHLSCSILKPLLCVHPMSKVQVQLFLVEFLSVSKIRTQERGKFLEDGEEV